MNQWQERVPKGPARTSWREERRRRAGKRVRLSAALMIPSMLYASGLACAMFAGQSLNMNTSGVVVFSCFAAVIVCCAMYNRFTLLASAAIIACATLYAAWNGVLYGFIVSLKYAGGFLLGITPHEQMLDSLLFGVIIGGSALLSGVLAFRLKFVFTMALIAMVLLIVEWMAAGEAVIPAAFLMCSGCIGMLALGGHNTAAPMQSVALALCFVLVAWTVGVFAVPVDTANMRVTTVERALDTVNDLFSGYTGFRRPYAAFSLKQMGYQPLGERLGGAVTLSDEDVLSVSGTGALLLRGNVRDEYTGYCWQTSGELATYQLDSPIAAKNQRLAFNIDVPPEGVVNGFSREIKLSVTHLAQLKNTVFTAGRVRSVDPLDSDIVASFYESGEVFSKREVEVGTSYVVYSRLPNTMDSSFAQIMGDMFTQGMLTQVEDEAALRNVERYTRLPENLPVSVRELAAELTSGIPNEYLRAQAIQRYLLDNFTYTLSPDSPPAEEDFVAHFLKTGEGYCTYFASAMAVIARCAGLPSRYIEGFLLAGSRREADGSYTVSADQAHAWVEVYVPGAGWLPFDATPSRYLPRRVTYEQMWTGVEPEEEESPVPSALTDAPQGETAAGAGWILPWWIILVGIMLIAIPLALVLILALHDERWSAHRLERKYPNPKDRLFAVWRDILVQLEVCGSPMLVGETPLSFALRCDRTIRELEGQLNAVAQELSLASYGGVPPTREAIDMACAYRDAVDARLKHNMGVFGFIAGRVFRRHK